MFTSSHAQFSDLIFTAAPRGGLIRARRFLENVICTELGGRLLDATVPNVLLAESRLVEADQETSPAF